MVGDFNLDWSSNSVLKESFETLMNLTQYSQLVTKYTLCFENLSTIIDLLFTYIQSLVSEHHVIKTDISVHFAIKLRSNCKPPKPVFSYITKRDFHKLDHCEHFKFAKFVCFHDIEKKNDVHRAA